MTKINCEAYLLTGEVCLSLWSTVEWHGGIGKPNKGLRLCESHANPVLRASTYFENGVPVESSR